MFNSTLVSSRDVISQQIQETLRSIQSLYREIGHNTQHHTSLNSTGIIVTMLPAVLS